MRHRRSLIRKKEKEMSLFLLAEFKFLVNEIYRRVKTMEIFKNLSLMLC